ncbi:LacI family DNA-binding transcriptional regulator [Sphingomonas gellani]|uniref:LacI family DNA-binding transcriptional regulator n=1 Tax=Sphingomonas gellani TaxID=1166340 RepID=UPI001479C2B1|nr:LacI family DNA-binding transcriptional regulator [Sphingomonas gellani]
MTIQAVADHVGVSAMTVSNVINGVRKVGDETRDAVLRAVEELEYKPNAAARALASAGVTCIGLVYQNAQNAFLSAMLVGTLNAASRLGAQVVIRKCDRPDMEEARAAIQGLVRSGANAILLSPAYAELLSGSALVAALRIPIAVIAQGMRSPDMITVGIDETAAARAVMQMLIEKGHQRIGFVTGPLDQFSGVGRLAGYRQALDQHGLQIEEELIRPGDFTFEAGLRGGEALLALPRPPTAIFASNDDMAAGVSSIAHRRGLAVPHDVAIVGFDDAPIAVKIWPPLTTVRHRVDLMAEWATEVLVMRHRTGENTGDQARRVGFELIVRESA